MENLKGYEEIIDNESIIYLDESKKLQKDDSIFMNINSLIVISTEFFTALSFYGFSSSIVLFFQTRLNYSNANADIQFSYWNATCNIAPLLGGYLADSTNVGRIKIILAFSCINLLGQGFAVFSAKPGVASASLSLIAIYILALGFGGVQPNLPTLGADQFDMTVEKDKVGRESFFAWYYFGINLGAFISYTLIAYICQYGLGAGGLEWGFFTGYLVCACSQGMAILVFLMGIFRYCQEKTASTGALNSVGGIVLEACWRRLLLLSSQIKSFFVELLPSRQQGGHRETAQEKPISMIHVLDNAKQDFGGTYEGEPVEHAKLLMRLVPFLIAMIPYWGCYSQMNTAFQNQACQMDLHLASVRIPVSALNVFDCLSILIFIPVFDRVIYPALGSFGFKLTMLGKIKLGFVVAGASMVCAAVVEIVRQRNAPPPGNYFNQRAVDNISPCQNIDDFNPFIYQQWQAGLTDSQPNYCTQTCNNTFYSVEDSMALLNLTCIDCDNIPQTSNLSVLWQIPQFTLIGISEILASITSIEFFYSQAPLPLRSICQALNTGTQALGAISLVPLIYAVNSIPSEMWLPSNLDTGYLDYYFFLLSVVMVIDWLLLLWISRGFQYKTEEQLSCKLDNSELDAILFSPYQRDASGEHSGDMTDSLLKHKQQIQ